MKKNQNGFSVFELIIIVLLLIVLGFAGWYIWWSKHHKDSTDASRAAPSTSVSPSLTPTSQAPDETAKWATYVNVAGKFSFRHPKTWAFASNPGACTEGLVLFASRQSALGRCASESAGQMMVMGAKGDFRDNYKIGQGYLTDYSNIVEASTTADGVAGIKQVATASGQEGVGTLPDGTQVLQYIFYVRGWTFIAQYTQLSTYPDASSDFDKLVTRTLKFLE